jgi:hypothetical protein
MPWWDYIQKFVHTRRSTKWSFWCCIQIDPERLSTAKVVSVLNCFSGWQLSLIFLFLT